MHRIIPAYTRADFPRGYLASAVAAGVKKKQGALDVSLIVSQKACTAAACFTQSKFQAAPVLVSRGNLGASASASNNANSKGIRAVITNAGCANACTGDQGERDAREMCKRVDKLIGVDDSAGASTSSSTLVMSTGVIGQPLPMDKIRAGIDMAHAQLSSDPAAFTACAHAFMTTDTFPKLRCRTVHLPTANTTVRIAGISKGAGMIHPNMATMLGIIWTDARIDDRQVLQDMTGYAVERSFNAITVDGDTSTNDTVVVLANNGVGMEREVRGEDLMVFREALTEFSRELAQLIVRDGEGATKFVTVHVANARSRDDAKKVATAICTSALVKTAFYGQDANWGRIVAAIGYSGANLVSTDVDLHIHSGSVSATAQSTPGKSLQLVRRGQPYQLDEEVASQIFRGEDITVTVDLNQKTVDGEENEPVTMWTCDFSKEYVAINADYRS